MDKRTERQREHAWIQMLRAGNYDGAFTGLWNDHQKRVENDIRSALGRRNEEQTCGYTNDCIQAVAEALLRTLRGGKGDMWFYVTAKARELAELGVLPRKMPPRLRLEVDPEAEQAAWSCWLADDFDSCVSVLRLAYEDSVRDYFRQIIGDSYLASSASSIVWILVEEGLPRRTLRAILLGIVARTIQSERKRERKQHQRDMLHVHLDAPAASDDVSAPNLHERVVAGTRPSQEESRLDAKTQLAKLGLKTEFPAHFEDRLGTNLNWDEIAERDFPLECTAEAAALYEAKEWQDWYHGLCLASADSGPRAPGEAPAHEKSLTSWAQARAGGTKRWAKLNAEKQKHWKRAVQHAVQLREVQECTWIEVAKQVTPERCTAAVATKRVSARLRKRYERGRDTLLT